MELEITVIVGRGFYAIFLKVFYEFVEGNETNFSEPFFIFLFYIAKIGGFVEICNNSRARQHCAVGRGIYAWAQMRQRMKYITNELSAPRLSRVS